MGPPVPALGPLATASPSPLAPPSHPDLVLRPAVTAGTDLVCRAGRGEGAGVAGGGRHLASEQRGVRGQPAGEDSSEQDGRV